MTVTIGIDPHKRTHTAVAIDDRGKTLDQLRLVADRKQVAKLLDWASRFEDRRWAVEGANGLGRLVAVGLVSAGERVVDVPATLSARIRTLGGTPHKTDEHDARSTVLAGRDREDLRPVRLDDATVRIGLLCSPMPNAVSVRAGQTGTSQRPDGQLRGRLHIPSRRLFAAVTHPDRPHHATPRDPSCHRVDLIRLEPTKTGP